MRKTSLPARLIQFLLLAVVFMVAYVIFGLVLTRLSQPSTGARTVQSSATLPPAKPQLAVISWNIGYGGLGADADFLADGGKDVLPRSPTVVAANVSGIEEVLRAHPSDVVLIQEISTGSMLNYWTDVLVAVEEALPGTDRAVAIDVTTAWLPPPLKVEHGNATASNVAMASAERLALPVEDVFILGVLRNNYSILETRHPIADSTRSWVLLNVHFSAFDRDGSVRRLQLAETMRVAQLAYEAGDPVVVGGDFNLEFAGDQFVSSEDAAHRFWLVDFPRDLIPDGWKLAYAVNAPTARTLAAPYRSGDTYTTVIDSFIVSPNVDVEHVENLDLQFAFSDHQPVIGRFAYAPAR